MSTSDHTNTQEDLNSAGGAGMRSRSRSGRRRIRKSRGVIVDSRSTRRLRWVIRVVLLVGILSYIFYQFYEAVQYDEANERIEPTVEQN